MYAKYPYCNCNQSHTMPQYPCTHMPNVQWRPWCLNELDPGSFQLFTVRLEVKVCKCKCFVIFVHTYILGEQSNRVVVWKCETPGCSDTITVHPHRSYSESYLDYNQIHFAVMMREPKPSHFILSTFISTDSLIYICLHIYAQCERKVELARCINTGPKL